MPFLLPAPAQARALPHGGATPAAGNWARARRAARDRAQRAPAPAALFNWLPTLAPPGGGGGSKLAERPLFKPSEMVQMGPFKVSPMGFGTWSWVSRSGRRGGLRLQLAAWLWLSGRLKVKKTCQECKGGLDVPIHVLVSRAKLCHHAPAAAQGNQLLWGYKESMDPELQQVGGLA